MWHKNAKEQKENLFFGVPRSKERKSICPDSKVKRFGVGVYYLQNFQSNFFKRPRFYFRSFHIPIQMANIQFEQYKLKKA